MGNIDHRAICDFDLIFESIDGSAPSIANVLVYTNKLNRKKSLEIKMKIFLLLIQKSFLNMTHIIMMYQHGLYLKFFFCVRLRRNST